MPKYRYTRRAIVDSKDYAIIDNKDEKNPIKTGIIGRVYYTSRAWSVKYLYKDKEYLKADEALKEYENDNVKL